MYNYWGGENILSPPTFHIGGGATPPRPPPAFYASGTGHILYTGGSNEIGLFKIGVM